MLKLTRREFLLLSGKTAAGAVLLSACGLPERELILQSPAESPEDLLHGDDSWYATTWPDGTNSEGVVARVVQGRVKKLAGNSDHPINQGKHSAYYDSGIQLLYHPDRIKTPLFRSVRTGNFAPISWDRAMGILREAMIAETTTIVTNPLSGSLCSVVEGVAGALPATRHISFDALEQGVLDGAMQRLYNTGSLPDLKVRDASTVLSFGADWLTGWLSPVQYSREYAEFRGGENRGYLIHADPRFSVTAANADLWLAVRPGYEGALALAMARVIIDEGLASSAEISNFMRNLPNDALAHYSSSAISELARVPEEQIVKAARRFGEQRPAVAFGGGSAGAHRNGSFNLAAIYALNTLVGNDFNSSTMAVGELKSNRSGANYRQWQEEELAQWRAGFNGTVVIRGVDIVHDMPRAAQIEQALERVDTVVTFANFMNDTALRSNLVLPETCFLEEWGTAIPDPGPGYPVVSFQQPVSGSDPTADEGARSFGDVILNVLPNGWNGQRDMRTVVRNEANAIFDMNGGGSVQAPNRTLFLQGVLQRGGWWNVGGSQSQSARSTGLLSTNIEVEPFDVANGDGEEFDLIPFQTVSHLERLAPSAWAQQVGDPISTVAWVTWAEINAQQAQRLGIREGDVIYVRSQHGEIQVVAYPNPGTPEGVLGVPIGFGYEDNGRYAEGVGTNVFKVLGDVRDEETGALAWAGTRVRVVRRGNRESMPKLEGDQVVRAAEPGVPVLVVAPGENAEAAEHRNEEEYRREFNASAPSESDEEEKEHAGE